MYSLDILLLVALVAAAVWTVLRGSLLRAVIALALTSIVLTGIIFRLGSPIAAVFELSVCAGLITVIFMSTISLTKPLSHKETLEYTSSRMKRFWLLPIIIAAVGASLALAVIPINFNTAAVQETARSFRNVLWEDRRFDLVGQIIIILAGVFGVVVLFRHHSKDEPEDK